MSGPRAPSQAEPADHPLRAAMARGDRLHARSSPALHRLLAVEDHSLLGEAVVAQVGGMLADLSRQLLATDGREVDTATSAALAARLAESEALRDHCHALALEWRLALGLEAERALDPVLSPLIQSLVAGIPAETSALAMAALGAQARFAQAQRRMALPLGELPAELFHAALLILRNALPGEPEGREARLRRDYEEGSGRLALLGRLAGETGDLLGGAALAVEEAGVALWLSVLAIRTGETRERTIFAASDRELGRLMLALRAAGAAPAEAERQALMIRPDAQLPRGLHDVGTREAAQWLAEARR
ncbi:MAG: hypothetical protein JNJ92_11455 [Altererythrobacter sp.]|nr:hypothetical protein [Altererythrobacter sp.]